jgi:hypothetical protein
MLAADIQTNIMSTFSFIKDLYSYFKFYRQQLEQWFVTMIAESLIKILSSVIILVCVVWSFLMFFSFCPCIVVLTMSGLFFTGTISSVWLWVLIVRRVTKYNHVIFLEIIKTIQVQLDNYNVVAESKKAMLKLDTCMLAADIQTNIMSTFSFIKDSNFFSLISKSLICR